MSIAKLAAAAFAIAITFASAAQHANATTIAPPERVSFNAGTTTFNAAGGSASTTVTPNTPANTIIDGQVQIDVTSLDYWWTSRPGQTNREAREEQANSWNFTLSHAGTTANLGGLPGATTDHWFTTNAFDGVTAGGAWVLTATSDYYAATKRMIEFNLAGFFNVIAGSTTNANNGGAGGAAGGSVPAPGGLLLILAGMMGISCMRRKA